MGAGTISYYTTFSFIFQHSKESLVKAHFVNLIHSLPSSSSMLSTLQSFDTYSMYTLSSIKTNQIQKQKNKKKTIYKCLENENSVGLSCEIVRFVSSLGSTCKYVSIC